MKQFYRVLQIVLPALALCAALGGIGTQDTLAASHSPFASQTATGRSCPPTIAYGLTGRWVRVVQTTLNTNGWRDPNGQQLVVDGQFGPKTLFVVRNFQSIYAPPADGIVGPQTWNALGSCNTGMDGILV